MTQNETILYHLKEHGSITDLQAYNEYAIRRLGARIWDLRNAGHKITSKTTRGVNRFGVKTSFTTYYLEDKKMSSMDELTIDELQRLNSLGFVAITGNGHVVAVVEEDKVEEYEEERCQHGY